MPMALISGPRLLLRVMLWTVPGIVVGDIVSLKHKPRGQGWRRRSTVELSAQIWPLLLAMMYRNGGL